MYEPRYLKYKLLTKWKILCSEIYSMRKQQIYLCSTFKIEKYCKPQNIKNEDLFKLFDEVDFPHINRKCYKHWPIIWTTNFGFRFNIAGDCWVLLELFVLFQIFQNCRLLVTFLLPGIWLPVFSVRSRAQLYTKVC